MQRLIPHDDDRPHPLDGVDDRLISRATAAVADGIGPDRVSVRMRRAYQQFFYGQQNSHCTAAHA